MSCITPLGDTVSVFPRLQYVFSSPLAGSSLTVAFSPPVSAQYEFYLNPFRDTLTVQCIGALDGNTRYTLRLGTPVIGVNGSRFNPFNDSTVLFTYPYEREPNDVKSMADSFTSIMFGAISDASDVDVFIDTAMQTRAIGLQSIDCLDSLYIVDGAGRSVAFPGQIRQTDTLRLPEGLTRPVYVFVLPGGKGSAGNYKLFSLWK
jgi:hypothetical protein